MGKLMRAIARVPLGHDIRFCKERDSDGNELFTAYCYAKVGLVEQRCLWAVNAKTEAALEALLVNAIDADWPSEGSRRRPG